MWATVAAAAVALAVTGYLSATLGGARVGPALLRNVGGGLVAMAITFAIGSLVGMRLD
jgi:VIT1/CCC1 family predicted Fe2+/Mn2+ transporter